MNITVIIISVTAIVGILASSAYIFYKKNLYIWFPYRIVKNLFNNNECKKFKGLTHIMFCFADHFEPGTKDADYLQASSRIDNWIDKYPKMAKKFKDSDGRPPQHTWFYPPHYHKHDFLKKLVNLCKKGFGEIELHLHHGGETSGKLFHIIKSVLLDYSRLGIFGKVGGKVSYGFIHGKSSLDNSRGTKWCGVNDELKILSATGCFADFTFPCMNKGQPKKSNSIFYATDNARKRKSYNTGDDVQVGRYSSGDLMIVQGPLGVRLKGTKRKFIPNIERASIEQTSPPTKSRVDFWVKSKIHVRGKPDWIFIKVHTHGAPEINHHVLLDEPIQKMHEYLAKQYNDGVNYALHYVTAREMYNIIKAAEAGEKGNPNQYRNYIISVPGYTLHSLYEN